MKLHKAIPIVLETVDPTQIKKEKRSAYIKETNLDARKNRRINIITTQPEAMLDCHKASSDLFVKSYPSKRAIPTMGKQTSDVPRG